MSVASPRFAFVNRISLRLALPLPASPHRLPHQLASSSSFQVSPLQIASLRSASPQPTLPPVALLRLTSHLHRLTLSHLASSRPPHPTSPQPTSTRVPPRPPPPPSSPCPHFAILRRLSTSPHFTSPHLVSPVPIPPHITSRHLTSLPLDFAGSAFTSPHLHSTSPRPSPRLTPHRLAPTHLTPTPPPLTSPHLTSSCLTSPTRSASPYFTPPPLT